MKTLSAVRFSFFALCIAIMGFGLTGCDLAKNQLQADRSGSAEIQDYRDTLAPRVPEVDEAAAGRNAASIPELQPYIAGLSNETSSMPLVSISVNQTVPLRDVLYQLAQQANYDIELDPRISGAIIFTARERPFDEVIDRISEIAGLRYKFDQDSLRVQLDTPFIKTYKLDYLTLVRSNNSSVRNDVSVVSGEGTDTGSNFQSSFENQIDFWGELEANLQQIINSQTTDILVTGSDPVITAAAQNPNVVPLAADGDTGDVSPPDVNLNIGALPIGSSDTTVAPSNATYAVNRQAGIVQVFATEKTQRKIKEYLDLVQRSTKAQVLIEAKILEVSLSDSYATGIDWRAFDGEFSLGFFNTAIGGVGAGTPTLPVAGATGAGSTFLAQYTGNDVSAFVNALSQFGTVKALASPRLTVLNNQSAVLNVATNRVFFEIDFESTDNDGGPPTVTLDSEIRNVPEGILVNVQPSINLEKGIVSMALRPTITRIVGTVNDPAVDFAAATVALNTGITSSIPELNVQEVDSIVEARSGQAIIMGGLLQDRAQNNIEAVPVLGEVPLVGNLFRQNDDSIVKTELVIMLKATILENPADSVHNTDRDIYRRFSDDRRPFRL